MMKEVRERLDAPDVKSVVLTAFILGTCALIAYKSIDPVSTLPVSLTTRGRGKILSVTPVNVMSQSKQGTKIYTDRYRVNFSYTVNGVVYVRADEVRNMDRNGAIINKLNPITADSVDIIYTDKQPAFCKIYLSGD